jgi:Tol biopolymer transport system component
MLSNKNHVQVLVTNISKWRNNSITKWTNMSRIDTNYTVVKSSRYLAKARASSDSLQRHTHVRVSAEERTPTLHARDRCGKNIQRLLFRACGDNVAT